jgi:hypothetical protein
MDTCRTPHVPLVNLCRVQVDDDLEMSQTLARAFRATEPRAERGDQATKHAFNDDGWCL